MTTVRTIKRRPHGGVSSPEASMLHRCLVRQPRLVAVGDGDGRPDEVAHSKHDESVLRAIHLTGVDAEERNGRAPA